MKIVPHIFILLTLVLVSLCNSKIAKAQNIDTLTYCGTYTVPYSTEFKNEPIEELSGIEYTGVDNQYYVIPQSRKKTHMFLCTIDTSTKGIEVRFDSVIYLNHGPLEAESIRINPQNKQLYIAEEGTGTSYIFKVTDKNELDIIYTSTSDQRSNSGYEGLCFNPSGTKMFIGLERPKKGMVSQIIACDLENHKEIIYDYTLDELPLDKKKDNGITELLSINDSTLLVVERAFLGAKHGNSIRVYKATIPTNGNEIQKVKLLTDFSASPEIDNIEGVTFSASGKELIFISDNNANPHQQTLFICMKIE